MTKKQKEERAEALQTVKEALASCAPKSRDHGLLVIDWASGGPSASGRTDYYTIRVFAVGTERDNAPRVRQTAWLSRLVAKALGYRYSDKREAIIIGGCGYNKAHHVASHLAKECGHPIAAELAGSSMGWVGDAR